MLYQLYYKPLIENAKKGFFDFYAKIKYTMFPEMYEEFDVTAYPTEFTQMMEAIKDDDTGTYEYELDLELPYGSFET